MDDPINVMPAQAGIQYGSDLSGFPPRVAARGMFHGNDETKVNQSLPGVSPPGRFHLHQVV